jgi:ATP/maltotriose-dependent transcriptional regulator MalT
LLETPVLERLSGVLCDAVTGRPGSQALLERVERAGLFLVPLDEIRGWWRYHHLFADLLHARLQAEQPPGWRSYTATPPPGTKIMGWPMRPSATRSPPGR